MTSWTSGSACRRAATASTSASRRGRPGSARSTSRARRRGAGLRVDLDQRPLPGRPAAHRCAHLRTVRGADGPGHGDPAGPPRPPRAGGRVPERCADGQDDLDPRRRQRRPDRARHRRRLEGGRVAGLRVRVPRARPSGWPSWRTTSRSSPGCSHPGQATYEGRHASVHDAIHEPKGLQEPRIPIMVGGNGPKVTWRLAARFADELNLDALMPDEVAAAMPVIAERCTEIGRDPGLAARLGVPLGPARAGCAGSRATRPAAPVREPRAQPGHRPGLRGGHRSRACWSRSPTTERPSVCSEGGAPAACGIGTPDRRFPGFLVPRQPTAPRMERRRDRYQARYSRSSSRSSAVRSAKRAAPRDAPPSPAGAPGTWYPLSRMSSA